MKKLIKTDKNYQHLIQQISTTYLQGQQKAVLTVNSHLVKTYWKIGQYIVEVEQDGKLKATYGKALLSTLAKDLSLEHGKGFSLSNIYLMRQFFIKYPKFQTASGKFNKLSWSHICELIPIDNPTRKKFL